MAAAKTTRRTADRDFSLVFWTPETPEAELLHIESQRYDRVKEVSIKIAGLGVIAWAVVKPLVD